MERIEEYGYKIIIDDDVYNYASWDEIEEEILSIIYMPDGRYEMRCVDGILSIFKEESTSTIYVDVWSSFHDEEDEDYY